MADQNKRPGTEGVAARRLAIRALVRIDDEGAYANLVLPKLLERSKLVERDRGLVTELVYGTVRMQRACDHLVDRFVLDEVEPQVRAALRMGAYQLHMMRTPPHAAVGATVGAVHGRGRSVVNAVLRRLATELERDAEFAWPDDATRLSYPDWILASFRKDLGADSALVALEAMNNAAEVHTREDGYIQDPASTLVVEAVEAGPGMQVADLCAAPGGKATALAATGATVVAADQRPSRVRLMAGNVASIDRESIGLMVADGLHPAIRPGSLDRVLIDAPCSGLGSLRRRPDARWRIDADAPERLADLQVGLVQAGLDLLKPGGVLTYSVCTLTGSETTGVLARVKEAGMQADMLPAPDAPWQSKGAVGYVLPEQSDGMSLFRLRRT